MHFTFLAARHAFRATPDQLDVDLSITSVDTDYPVERAGITVTIHNSRFKDLTLTEIEDLAIARAKVLLAA
jgi:hypothetical protein